MADIDSGAARNRQAPRTAVPARPVSVAKPKPRVVRKKKTSTSSGSSHKSSSSYRTNAVARRASGSSGSSHSGGGRRVSDSTPARPSKPTKVITPVSPPKPVQPKPPGIATSLRSDTVYQQQMAAYAKALADYQADQTLQRGDYEKTYQQNYRDIGLAKTDALKNLENDYAARGLLRSSLYNTDVGELNQQYQNQYNDLAGQRTSFLDQLGQGLVGFKNEQATQQQQAMQEALRRRAEKYNL